MNRLEDLMLFLRVLDQGSISAAARSLDLSVAVASQHLKRLEGQLGVPLLYRTTRRLHPTPEGAALASHGRALVEDLEALMSGLRQGAGEVEGVLRLTMSASFGRRYVSPLLPTFLARHPGIRLSVDQSDAVQDLVKSGLDLAIRIGTLQDSTLIARRLADDRRVLVASPDYLRRRGVPREPEDLREHEGLLLVGRSGRPDVWELTDASGRQHSIPMRGRFESNDGELLRDAVVNGLGIALQSTWHVCDDLQSGRLERVLPDCCALSGGIWAVMPQRRLVPPRVHAFVELLSEAFGGTPPWDRAPAPPTAAEQPGWRTGAAAPRSDPPRSRRR